MAVVCKIVVGMIKINIWLLVPRSSTSKLKYVIV